MIRFMRKLSVFFALLGATATASAGDFVALVQKCEGCHGKDGVSTTPDVPIIAGFSHEGFFNTIDSFRLGDRVALKFHKPGEPEIVMNDIAKSLSDEDVRGLADYFSQRPFKPAAQSVDTELARRGEVLHKKLCDKCHEDNGAHPVEDAAILAGQHRSSSRYPSVGG